MEDQEQEEKIVEETSKAVSENEENIEITETNVTETDVIEKENKKKCVCKKSSDVDDVEKSVDHETCEDMPEEAIEELEPVQESNDVEDVEDNDIEDFEVTIVDPNKKVETSEIGICTEDFLMEGDPNNLELKSEIIREFKETQTDFDIDEENNQYEILESEKRELELMMQRVNERQALEQKNVTKIDPTNIEFEIILDFLRETDKTIMNTASIINKPGESSGNEIQHEMELIVGEKEEIFLTKSTQDLKGPTSTKCQPSNELAPEKDEDFSLNVISENSVTLDDYIESDDSIASQIIMKNKSTSTLDELDLGPTRDMFIQTSDNEKDDESGATSLDEEAFEKEKTIPDSSNPYCWFPTKDMFKELNSIVKTVAMLYAQFDEALTKQNESGMKYCTQAETLLFGAHFL